jgi:MOSC domain-containing protein YiiM
VEHRTTDELTAALDVFRSAPADNGVLQLIVRRPDVDEREVLEAAALSVEDGLVGDTWKARGSRHTDDGSAETARQLTLMNARAIDVLAGDRSRWALAGDQLFVDLDLSGENLPPGTRLRLGEATIEVSEEPHTGCAKFMARFGQDAARFVNSPDGRALNLRGINARVVQPGTIHVGDAVTKL